MCEVARDAWSSTLFRSVSDTSATAKSPLHFASPPGPAAGLSRRRRDHRCRRPSPGCRPVHRRGALVMHDHDASRGPLRFDRPGTIVDQLAHFDTGTIVDRSIVVSGSTVSHIDLRTALALTGTVIW